MNNFFLILLLCFHLCKSYDLNNKIVYSTIPKSGTHLLRKCLTLMTGSAGLWIGMKNGKHIDENNLIIIEHYLNKLQPTSFLITHLPYSVEIEKLLRNYNTKFIFMYRDLRDQLVSYVHFLQRDDTPENVKAAISGMSFDQILESLIIDNRIYDVEWRGQKNVKEFYDSFIPWLQSEFCHFVRFENLIGPKGGGSLLSQYTTIESIAKYIGIELNSQQIEFIMTNLFGSSFSFHKGQIGSWRKYFTEKHKKLFKDVAGQLLIELGYETDNTW